MDSLRVLALALVALGPLTAQGTLPPNGGQGEWQGKQGRRHPFAELGLTEDQLEQVRTLFRESGDPRKMSPEARKEFRMKIFQILTPEQREKLRELREKHRRPEAPEE